MPRLSILLLRWLPLVFVGAVIAQYFLYLSQHVVNIPFEDDLFDVLLTINTMLSSQDIGSALQPLYAKFNHHATTTSRLTYFLVYLQQGEINFRLLNMMPGVALVVILGLLSLSLRHNRYRWGVTLVAALILFQLRAHVLIFWSMAAFAYMTVFMYGFCCLYSLHKFTPVKFVAAIVFAVLASLSFTSGLLIWFVGAISLAHQTFCTRDSSLRYLFLWLGIGAATIVFWVLMPVSPGANFEIPGAESMPTALWDGLQHQVRFFLVLTGSAFSEGSIRVSSIGGCLLLLALLAASYRGQQRDDIRLELCCWYIVLTLGAITYGRATLAPIEYGMASRFSFPSVLLLTTLTVLVWVRWRIAWAGALVAAILLSASYSTASYCVYSEAVRQEINPRVRKFNRDNLNAMGRSQEETDALMRDALALGVYVEPKRPHPRQAESIGWLPASQCKMVRGWLGES